MKQNTEPTQPSETAVCGIFFAWSWIMLSSFSQLLPAKENPSAERCVIMFSCTALDLDIGFSSAKNCLREKLPCIRIMRKNFWKKKNECLSVSRCLAPSAISWNIHRMCQCFLSTTQAPVLRVWSITLFAWEVIAQNTLLSSLAVWPTSSE